LTARLSSWKCWLLAVAVATSACGYHVAGRGDRLPPDVKVIAVPTLINQTKRFRIEQQLTAAIVRELIERTRFKVLTEPEGADAVIEGTVKNIATGVIAFNLSTGAATALQVVVTADVRLVDQHTHKVLFSNPRYVFREEYEISQSNTQLFEEEGPALDRLSRDFAHTLVTDILENF
jgi:curli biogenesis system outer membrane secretion channel CsgG